MTTTLPHEERVLHKVAQVSGPVEDVWWAWTTEAGLRSWLLADCRVELRVGGSFEWYFDPDGPRGSRGSEGCQVIGFQAPTMLTFSWNAPPHLPQARAQRTVVLLRLRRREPAGTTVELTHLGWGDGGQWDDAYDYFDAAWSLVLTRLEGHFAPAPVQPTG